MAKLKSALLVVFLLEEMFLSSAHGIIFGKHGRSLMPRIARSSTLEEMEKVPHKARNNRRIAVNDKYDNVKNSQISPEFFMLLASTDPPNISDE